MTTRSQMARMATVLILVVACAGLLSACGSGGAIAGAAVGAAVGGAIGSTYDDPYYNDPYYYSVSPGEYENEQW